MIIPKLQKAVYLLFFCSLLFSLSAQDQDTAATAKPVRDSIATLDKVVVTATRTNRLMSETPASVSVITEAEIEVSPAKNIDDMLQYETGVHLKRTVGIGEGIPSDIIIRGISGTFGATRTLILVDGIPTNASGTPFLILNEVPMDAIKRVEIVRGPYSSLYGANAFGGVINIITKRGYGRPGFDGYLESSYPFTALNKYVVSERSIGTSLGESWKDTYWNLEGATSGGNDRVHYFASAGARTIGNYLLRDYAINKRDSTLIKKENRNYDYRDIRFLGKCGISLNEKTDVELQARYFTSDLGFGRTRKILPDSIDIVSQGQKFVIGPSVRFRVNNNVTVSGRAYYRTLVGEFWNEEPLLTEENKYVPGYWKSQQQDWMFESQGLITAGKHQVITSGIEYLGNFINFGEKINPETDSVIPGTYAKDTGIANIALYVQDEISLFNRLNIVPGIRWDYHTEFGGAISPKIGAAFSIFDWLRVRSSVGRAFRAPTLSELYMPNLTIRYDFVLKPNPNLTPEYIWAVDCGLEIIPVPTLHAQIFFYNNNMKDLIGQTIDATDKSVTYDNMRGAWGRGIEVEIEWELNTWLGLYGNYVFQRTRNEEAAFVRELFQTDKNYEEDDFKVSLDYVPDHSADIGVSFKKEIGSFLLEAQILENFTGERTYFEWTEVNDTTDIKLIPGDDKVHVYVDPPLIRLDPVWKMDFSLKCTYYKTWFAFNIQNIFDAVYEEAGGTLTPGRFASLKIGVKF